LALRAAGAGAAWVETAIGPAKIEITNNARRNANSFFRKLFTIVSPNVLPELKVIPALPI